MSTPEDDPSTVTPPSRPPTQYCTKPPVYCLDLLPHLLSPLKHTHTHTQTYFGRSLIQLSKSPTNVTSGTRTTSKIYLQVKHITFIIIRTILKQFFHVRGENKSRQVEDHQDYILKIVFNSKNLCIVSVNSTFVHRKVQRDRKVTKLVYITTPYYYIHTYRVLILMLNRNQEDFTFYGNRIFI